MCNAISVLDKRGCLKARQAPFSMLYSSSMLFENIVKYSILKDFILLLRQPLPKSLKQIPYLANINVPNPKESNPPLVSP